MYYSHVHVIKHVLYISYSSYVATYNVVENLAWQNSDFIETAIFIFVDLCIYAYVHVVPPPN